VLVLLLANEGIGGEDPAQGEYAGIAAVVAHAHTRTGHENVGAGRYLTFLSEDRGMLRPSL